MYNFLSNSKDRKAIFNGKLPLIEKPNEFGIEMNELIKTFNKKHWEIINDLIEDESTFNFFMNVRRTISNVKSHLDKCFHEYKMHKEFTNSYLIKSTEALKPLIEKDNEANAKRIENERMSDLSMGIFSHEEAGNRAMFNSLFNYQYSQESDSLISEINMFTKQSISFLYIKFEEIIHLSVLFIPKDKKFIKWIEKFDDLNIILDKSLEEIREEANNFMKFANALKHQQSLFMLKMDLDRIFALLDKIFDKCYNKINFKEILEKLDYLYYEYDNITNPLGLTGFE